MTPDAHDEAVKAAAEALSECYEGAGGHDYRTAAEFAVAAAAPILLAAERQRIAEAIRASRDAWLGLDPRPTDYPVGSPSWAVMSAYDDAARIAEANP